MPGGFSERCWRSLRLSGHRNHFNPACQLETTVSAAPFWSAKSECAATALALR